MNLTQRLMVADKDKQDGHRTIESLRMKNEQLRQQYDQLIMANDHRIHLDDHMREINDMKRLLGKQCSPFVFSFLLSFLSISR
jgi:hypothetical protein